MKIEEKINKALEDMRKELNTPFSASQSGYPGLEGYCRRKRIYSYFFPEQALDDEVMKKGFFTEIAYKELLRKAYGKIIEEKEFIVDNLGVKEFYIHPDVIIPDMLKIVEIKATRKIPELPYEKHRIQVGLQLMVLPEYEGEIHYVEYEGRKWNVKSFTVDEIKEEELKKVIDENKLIAELLRYDLKDIETSEAVFPTLGHPYQFPCSWWTRDGRVYCPFWDRCYQVQEVYQDIEEIEEQELEKLNKVIRLRKLAEKRYKRLQELEKQMKDKIPNVEGKFKKGSFIISISKIPEKKVEYVQKEYYRKVIKEVKE